MFCGTFLCVSRLEINKRPGDKKMDKTVNETHKKNTSWEHTPPLFHTAVLWIVVLLRPHCGHTVIDMASESKETSGTSLSHIVFISKMEEECLIPVDYTQWSLDTPARCCLFSLSIDKVTAGGVLAIT